MMSLFDRWRRWRLGRAEDALADRQHYFDTWVEPFDRRLGTFSPSRMKREVARVERARRRVVKRGGTPDA